jgi:hypothetical protein
MKNDQHPDESVDINADMDTDTTEEAVPMRILLIREFPSLSGRSSLIGHVAVNEQNAIFLRIWKNSGAGMFLPTFQGLAGLSKLLSVPGEFSSSALQPAWEGSSKNGAGFTAAHLLNLGLIERSLTKRGAYRTADPGPFLASINALIESNVDLDPDDEPSDEQAIAATEAPKRGRPKKQST